MPTCFQININGLDTIYKTQKTKSKLLNEIVSSSEQFIPYFIVTETHLKSYHFDAEVDCPNYTITRSDRPMTTKGGVAIYMHNTLSIDSTNLYADKICQAVCIYNNLLNLIIIGVYRPPSRNLPEEENSFRTCLNEIQDVIKEHPNADIQIHGDLNFPFINWDTLEINHSGRLKCEQNSAKALLSFMQKNLLVQMVTENTRHDKSILDILLTNNDQAIHSITTEVTTLSDHDFVHCTLLYNELKTPTIRKETFVEKSDLDKLNLNKADYDGIRKDLSEIDWPSLLKSENSNSDEMYDIIKKTITRICNDHAPKHPADRKSYRGIPKHRRSLLRTRRHVNQEINKCKYLKPNNYENKLKKLMKKKESLELKIRDCINQELLDNEANLIKKIKTNPRAFYTYAKKNCKSNCSIGPLLNANKILCSDPTEMSNILQKQYQKAFSDPTSGVKKPASDPADPASEINLSDIIFTEKDIITAIEEIPLHSAPGPDKIPSKFLKECKNQIAPALLILWRTSLDTGQVPKELKKQSIIPIYKKDSKAIAANYRPVSLTSHIIKLFERVLRKHIVKFLEDHQIIHSSQHGFRPCRSCLTQLLHHLESVLNILETNQNADVVYLDLSKAFDKVNHEILIHKLQLSGISGKILLWVKNFLDNRTQKVVIDGAQSDPAPVISGVPQGTVLGPVLFIIYMNDLHQVIKNSILKCFADDSKLIMNIKNRTTRLKLMEDLKAILQWTEDNSMKFNIDKFQLLQHGNNPYLKIPYRLPNGQTLEGSENVRDLGLNISADLKWKYHTKTVNENATKFANWILRTIRSRDVEIMLLMFRSYVLSRLEYVSPVWNPMSLGDIIKLEAVQRSFTSKISGLEDLNYWQRLSRLKLYSLQRRRERFIFIHMWKIFKGLAPNDLEFQFQNHVRLGPQCKRKIYKCSSMSVSSLRHNYFSCIGPRLFNILPSYIKKSNTLETLKSRLDKFLINIPDKPPTPGYASVNSNSLLELTYFINRIAADMKVDGATVDSLGAS